MQRFHIPLLMTTIIAAAIWLYLYLFVSPYVGQTQEVNVMRLAIFLVSFGITITGLGTLLGYHLRKLISPHANVQVLFYQSLRQSAIFAGGVVFIFILSTTYTLTIATAFLTLAALVVLEWFFH